MEEIGEQIYLFVKFYDESVTLGFDRKLAYNDFIGTIAEIFKVSNENVLDLHILDRQGYFLTPDMFNDLVKSSKRDCHVLTVVLETIEKYEFFEEDLAWRMGSETNLDNSFQSDCYCVNCNLNESAVSF